MLLLALVLVLTLVSLLRALGGNESGTGAPAASTSPAPSDGGTSDDGGASDDAGASDTAGEPADGDQEALSSPTPEAETGAGDAATQDDGFVRTGTDGEGTWTVAAAEESSAGSAEGSGDGEESERATRTYAVRVEDGIGIDAEDAAAEIASVLADPRGWQDLEAVSFRRVADPDDAEFTISVGSPPTVDELCLPARTGGLWSCRIGGDVALNSDRWLHATPTYEDLTEYRAYMINHEVGHFLGHGHARCGGEDEPAPVMLQQSMDLEGCTPNAWPATGATG